jgi:hypothetical protein
MAKKVKEVVSVATMLSKLIDSGIHIKDNAIKFDAGNSSAGTKVRVALQDLKVQIKDIRDAVTAVKEARKK